MKREFWFVVGSQFLYGPDVLITVESTVAKSAPILKIGTQEVRAGRTFIFKTREFEMSTLIDEVTVE